MRFSMARKHVSRSPLKRFSVVRKHLSSTACSNSAAYPIDLERRPVGFGALDSEPVFNPSIHLQLERPAGTFSLTDLGYSGEDLETAPVPFAATTVFRLLSDEGAAALYEVAKLLETFASSNDRIERCVRGGVYRSNFLRDLCLCKEITAFLSVLAGIEMVPHTIPHQLGHINYNPTLIGKNVDKWHVDTLRLDYVMFVTDPTKNSGGQFQYFKGTKYDMAALKDAGNEVPQSLINSPEIPGPGYAVLLQGNMVVHQAKGLTAPGERITMVNGYVPADPAYPDYSRYDQLVLADPDHVVTSEYSRHVAIQAKRYLDQHLIACGDFHNDRDLIADKLSVVAGMLEHAATEIRRAEEAKMEHFGD